MAKSDEYQRPAEECQRMASTASTDREKRSWMELGESWLRMMTVHRTVLENNAEQKFEAELQENGTGQERSDESN